MNRPKIERHFPFATKAPGVQIIFNGDARDVREAASIAELLAELQLAPKLVAVEVNREVVPRKLHDTHRLAAGDEVEVVTLVGGG